MRSVTEHLSIPTAAGSFDAIAAGPHDGRPVLLLHGFPEAAIEWRHQVAVLGERGFRAVAPDQRGYSPDVRPERPAEYGITALVDDVIAVADALGWPRFDLVGHDWGGAVAWWTASEHPDRLRSLTVVSTPHPAALATAMKTDEDQANRSRYMTEWRNTPATEKAMLADDARALRQIFGRDVPRDAVDEYVQRLQEPGALTAALNWYRSGRPPSAIGPIETSVLYVWSTDDAAFGDVAAFGTREQCTGPYRFEMLEDVSHWAPEQAPEAITTLILEHLDAT
ncbi:Pimeloyl-ACP methyl ester carboxylesterase [Tsukamurella pulmonis]|uniref:Pimeloyl-ACP methyl ester carboxylesterase n=1 Tax=Tsukamurella pulmonis TaxID=47312 RepID=A0A1H1FDP1_9ACTN|nr:Pimeloyl-ACP methyl ester carboxylesterase [Tsukamurella pulmonis]SUP19659.1 Soluble epoxide hydrolase [Tsukamurella pulmonis]